MDFAALPTDLLMELSRKKDIKANRKGFSLNQGKSGDLETVGRVRSWSGAVFSFKYVQAGLGGQFRRDSACQANIRARV